jgi:hypothetical protein
MARITRIFTDASVMLTTTFCLNCDGCDFYDGQEGSVMLTTTFLSEL